MKNKISLTIDGRSLQVDEGITILKAAEKMQITIPTLCHHEDLCVAGNCRICVVEQVGSKLLKASCCTPVSEGMEILSNSRKVREARRDILSLLLSEHNDDCNHCSKNNNCELQRLTSEYDLEDRHWISLLRDFPIDISSPSIEKDDQKCIKCQRCVRTCKELQNVNALAVVNRGGDLRISTFLDKPLDDVICTNCGQCVNRCPTGALVEKSYIKSVWKALDDPGKHVVVQTAPAVRVAIGETFGEEPGRRNTGKMVSCLRRLGFDAVFDTNFTADLTIIEEGTELLDRLKRVLVDKEDVKVPMFTSCSPGWVKFMEHNFPDMLDNLSTCKSPQQMFGALAKTYYARKKGINPKDLIVVSIMPCTAKKYENQRPEMYDSGFQDVDYVLTTREFGKMIIEAGIRFDGLEESQCDSLLGSHTGAGVIFGATGGVMEAALRTAYEIVTGREVPFDNLNILPVRGFEGIKEATVTLEDCKEEWSFLNGQDLKLAIAHGLKNAGELVKSIHEGKAFYHFVEVMACPGGCLGGGGQPIPTTAEIRKKRSEAIYREDEKLPLRKSHDNPEVIRLYEDFLKKPGGEKSHTLLHTKYRAREW
jgi:iron-only hydrogenase group A